MLDEPTAGLDPNGTVAMMKLFRELNQKHGKTVLIVTHDMEQVFSWCDRVIVVENGAIRCHQDVKEFFHSGKLCTSMNILPPALIRIRDALNEKGFSIPEDVQDMDGLCRYIIKEVKHG